MARTRGLQPATGPNRDGATCAALAGTFSFGSSGSKQQEQESRLARIARIVKIAKIANSLRVERVGGSKSMIQLQQWWLKHRLAPCKSVIQLNIAVVSAALLAAWIRWGEIVVMSVRSSCKVVAEV